MFRFPFCFWPSNSFNVNTCVDLFSPLLTHFAIAAWHAANTTNKRRA